MGLALVEEGRNSHLSGRSEKVCELRVGLCPIIARVNGADGMEELSSGLPRFANAMPISTQLLYPSVRSISRLITSSVRRATLSIVASGFSFQVRCPIATVVFVELCFGLVAVSIIRNGSVLSLIYGSES